MACSDPHAFTCSSHDVSYSLSCEPGYTAGFLNNMGGFCYSCADNCMHCDASGLGKCDSGRCDSGFVVLTGTTVCTQCNGGCAICSKADASVCISCGQGSYPDGSGACLRCPNGCQTCTSATVCTSCVVDYLLDGTSCSISIKNCRSIASNICLGCFVGYTFDGINCVVDLGCTGASNCVVCPDLYYLLNSTCVACTATATNCVSCRRNNIAICTGCKYGFYLDSANTCQPCRNSCRTCDLPQLEKRTAHGFFVSVQACESCVTQFSLKE